jgi:hypothetical protein
MKSRAPKLYDKVDYDFRPESFWVVADPLVAILRNVKGRNRREMIKDYYAAGKLDELCSDLLNDSLDEDARRSLGQIHPTFMGGEYLPNYRRHEVEIARIELQSTTSDVISLRARGSGLRIKYRLVDEYQSEFGLPQQTSQKPFSLRELIVFLDFINPYDGDPNLHRFGFPLLYNQANLGADPKLEDLESLRDFTRVSSDFYPDLALHYSKVIGDWYSVRKREIQMQMKRRPYLA